MDLKVEPYIKGNCFLLAKKRILPENIEIEGPRNFDITRTFPQLTLIGGQSCLEFILIRHSSKIYHHFLNHYAKSIQSFSVRCSQNLNFFKQKFFFEFKEQKLNINLAIFSFAEFRKKELRMDFRVIEGGLASEFQQNSTNIQLKNKNSARIYSSRKKFALDFIKKSEIKLSNLSKNEDYKYLSKNEKDAIRYYLKKDEYYAQDKKIKIRKKKTKKNRGSLDIRIAVSLLIPVIFSEYIILTFSYLFYLSLGFSISISIVAATSVELFFMITSGSKKLLFQSLRWLIFSYSAFTVCYSTFINDPQVTSLKKTIILELKHLEFRLNQQKKISSSLEIQQQQITADMDVYRRNEMVTLGRKRLSKEKKLIKKSITLNENKIESLMEKISALKQSQLKKGPFSKENIDLVEIRTWSVMFFLTLIQLLSSICTNEFSHSFRKFAQKKKRNKKKESFMGWHMVT